MTNPLRIAIRLRPVLWFASGILAGSSTPVVAQRAVGAPTLTGTIIVHVTADSTPIPGVTIAAGTANTVTDRLGLAKFTLPTGRRTFRATPVGFRPESLAVYVGVGTTNVTIPLRHKTALPDVFAATTRDGRPITETARPRAMTTTRPTRVEVTDRDVLDEQLDGSAGSISELLAHSGGVRIQQLSAGSGGAGIRIRGLPARYTKILSDGLPLYGSTPEGLDLLQIPTIDLQRIELIKGVTSPLYGPSALSGVVNLVSAPPTSPSAVVVNGTSRLGSDVTFWQTHTFTPQWAASLVAGRNYQNSDDLDADGWAEVSGYRRIVVRPRAYWSRSDQSSWFMTGGWTSENRWSGTFGDARLPDFHTYSDDANTRRADAGTVGRIQLDSNSLLTIRASTTKEWRTRWYGENRENDRRTTIFSEVALKKSRGAHALVTGAALERDQYSALDTRGQSYRYTTPALFAEHTWTPDTWYSVTSSARLDLQSEFGDFVSPRVSVFVHPSDEWNARLSAANGVYAPTPLTDETEAYGLSHIRSTGREAEHATGWSLDVSRVRGAVELRGSAYRTIISHPLVLRTRGEELQLVNADESSRTQGIDASIRYRMRPLRFTASYSYIDASRPEIGEIIGEDFRFDTTMRRVVPFNPRHAANLEVAHERENDRVIGVEAHFVGRQAITDTLVTYSQPYVTIDARLEKHVRRAVVFVRGRNLTGVHQSQFAPLLRRASGSSGQWTNDVWAPLDGLVVNAGLRLQY
jgi:outer membrane receptor for ferrienterochelin and colicins